MQDIADDRDRKVLEAALVPTNGQHVEHALGRVCVATVTTIDDRHLRANMFGDEVGRARITVTYDKHVGSHGFEIAQGIEQCLALAGRGGRHVEGDHIG
ncbi:hypothetical protein D9M73_151690 [compost metagenome]